MYSAACFQSPSRVNAKKSVSESANRKYNCQQGQLLGIQKEKVYILVLPCGSSGFVNKRDLPKATHGDTLVTNT